MTDDAIPAYRSARQRLTAFARGLDDAEAGQPVLACPGWRVRDVVGHRVGAAADLVAGNSPTDEEWTARQVASRRDRPFSAVLDEWDERGPEFEVMLAGDFPIPPAVFGDLDLGGDDAAATVTAPAFDVLRAATGRRTADEIRGFEWKGEADPYVGVFAPFPLPEAPLPA